MPKVERFINLFHPRSEIISHPAKRKLQVPSLGEIKTFFGDGTG
jgi:hypothetical protein